MFIEHLSQIKGSCSQITAEVNSVLEAIFQHENYHFAVITWKDLYSILQAQYEVTSVIFENSQQMEEKCKKIQIYKKAFKKMKEKQVDPVILAKKDEEIHMLQSQLRSSNDQLQDHERKIQELEDNQNALLDENE